MTRRAIASSLVVLALLLAACGGDGDGSATSPTDPAVDRAAADGTVLALCELAGVSELEEADEIFHDRAHEPLHEIADAAGDVDRPAAGDLLAAKQVVEADLLEPGLPATFPADVVALVAATGAALVALGIESAACPA